METNRHILYTVQGAGSYNLELFRTGTGTINLKITDMKYAHTLMFNSTSGEYYIFDDNPEFIRRCDILDDDNEDKNDKNKPFPPTSLMHAYNLGPGVYNVFTYHHTYLKPRPSRSNNFTKASDTPLYFPDDATLYFDAVFSNVTENVKIRKIGFHSYTDTDDSGNLLGWTCNEKAYEEYKNGSALTEYKRLGKLQNDGSLNPGNSAVWLSDITGEKRIRPKDPDIYGVAHLLMEFEVTGGTVNFSTVAYKNKTRAKEVFNQHTPEELQGKYEEDATVKGIAHDSKTKTANTLTYVIDEDKTQTLYMYIENQFYDSKWVDCFETNCNPWGQMNHFSGSSAVNIEYEGQVVTKRDMNTGAAEVSEHGTWYLDSLHSRYTTSYSIPEDAKFGVYAEREYFNPNERFNDDWLKSISLQSSKVQTNLVKEFNAHNIYDQISNSFIAYGITYEIPVRVYNATDKDMYFYYKVDGHLFKTEFEAYGESGQKAGNIVWSDNENGDKESKEGSHVKRRALLKKGEWTNIIAKTTLLTGSNGEVRHEIYVSAE